MWHPHLEDVGNLGEDGEMIKGLEKGRFEDGKRRYLVPRRAGWGVT